MVAPTEFISFYRHGLKVEVAHDACPAWLVDRGEEKDITPVSVIVIFGYATPTRFTQFVMLRPPGTHNLLWHMVLWNILSLERPAHVPYSAVTKWVEESFGALRDGIIPDLYWRILLRNFFT